MSFQIKWSLILKGLKFLGIIAILSLLGYAGYLAYYFATNQPYEIRVTNVTGSSATVSWYTKRKDMGVVAYKPVNSFISPLAWFGANLAYDDRDVALAQEAWVNDNLEKSVKDIDSENQVQLTEEDLNGVRVNKKGKYYVHHVTIPNLSENSNYFFRVGNGIFFWNIKEELQKYDESIEAPTVSTATFKTFAEPDSISTPNTAYGKVLSTARNSDGFIIDNESTDSIVFARAIKSANSTTSSYQSSVTNSFGGWVIDKANFRDEIGNPISSYTLGNDMLETYVQFESLSTEFKHELVWGIEDAPSYDYIVDNSKVSEINGTLLDKIKFSINNYNSENNILSNVILNSFAQQSTCTGGEVWNSTFQECVKPATTPSTPPAPTTPATSTNLSSPSYNPSTVDEKLKQDLKAKSCTGEYSYGCELTDMCYAKCTDGSYVNLKYTCRPASCATIRNGDYSTTATTTPRQKPKLDENGNQVMINGVPVFVLCGTDVTGDCAIDAPKYVTGGVICPEGQTAVMNPDNTYRCEKTSGGENNGGVVSCNVQKVDCLGTENVTGKTTEQCTALSNARKNSCEKKGSCIIKSKDGKSDQDIGPITLAQCNRFKNLLPSNCSGRIGQFFDVKTNSCKCDASLYIEDRAEDGSLMCVSKLIADLPFIPNSGNGKCTNGDAVYNCGSSAAAKCSDSDWYYTNGNEGCAPGNYCLFSTNWKYQGMGVCAPKGFDVGVTNLSAKIVENNDLGGIAQFSCYVKINSSGKLVDAQIVIFGTDVDKIKSGNNEEGSWSKVFMDACINVGEVGSNRDNNSTNDKKISFISKVGAQSSNTVETDGDYLIIFPESGVYDVQIGDEKFKNVYVNEDNKHFFYVEKNGIEGYQLPENGKNPKADEDELLPANGAIVTLYEKTDNQELKISNGINIVSFNYVPARYEGKNMNARQLMRILNSSGVKVTRITTFEGGKWAGGIAFDNSKNEIVGNDFLITPGKGYLIVSNSTYTATVPGYGIKNSIPVALSSGWNLIGINGFKKTYTASTLIDSINEIDGVGSNNVTWWPTSKGRYDTFQKSEGVEYGFDFPILKDIGYFVRVNEFDRKGDKSVIWNPGGQLHGEAGSNK